MSESGKRRILVLPYRTVEMKINGLPWCAATQVNGPTYEVCNYLYLKMPTLDPDITDFVRFVCHASHNEAMVTLGHHAYSISNDKKVLIRHDVKNVLKSYNEPIEAKPQAPNSETPEKQISSETLNDGTPFFVMTDG